MGLSQRIQNGVGAAKFKANQLLRINQMQSQIGDLQRQIATIRSQIAMTTLALHKEAKLTNPDLIELCVKVGGVEKQIADIEAQIAIVRSEVPPMDAVPDNTVRCPMCSRGVPPDAAFCVHCGSPMPRNASGGELR